MPRFVTPNGTPTLMAKIIPQLIAFLVCVAAPAGLTAVAPVSWLTFQRQGDHVSAQAKVCLLFIIPYKVVKVDPVTEVSDSQIAGSYTKHRRSSGSDYYTQSETEGFLTMKGPNGEDKVSVSPHDLKQVKEKVEAFLKDPKATELKQFVTANWKFGVIGGGVMSLFTVLWVLGVGSAFVMMLLRAVGLAKPARTSGRTGLP